MVIQHNFFADIEAVAAVPRDAPAGRARAAPPPHRGRPRGGGQATEVSNTQALQGRFPHFIYKSTRKALEVNTLQPKQYNFLQSHSLLHVMIGHMNKLEGGRNNLAGPSNGMARYATTV